jgi:ribose transport system substrate-binding protein
LSVAFTTSNYRNVTSHLHPCRFRDLDQLVKFLQDGTIAALVVQDPFRMGYEGVRTALAASKGEQVPANIDTGAIVITKANMNSARSQELLNPKIK